MLDMGYNERKIQILEFVLENESVTSQEVADHLGITIHNAGMRLLNYHRQGLLYRSWDGGPRYDRRKIYSLTPKGDDRIEWLREVGVGWSSR